MKRKERVAIAMSGGVDSSVAAALLKKQGFEVIGLTMRFPGYCSGKGAEDALAVARKLNIKHFVLNGRGFLDKYVINDFCREYAKGRTTVISNQEMLRKAKKFLPELFESSEEE